MSSDQRNSKMLGTLSSERKSQRILEKANKSPSTVVDNTLDDILASVKPFKRDYEVEYYFINSNKEYRNFVERVFRYFIVKTRTFHSPADNIILQALDQRLQGGIVDGTVLDTYKTVFKAACNVINAVNFISRNRNPAIHVGQLLFKIEKSTYGPAI